MKILGHHSILTRTLLQIGAATSLILVAITALVYWKVLQTIEEQVVQTLTEYSLERSKRESILFTQGEENLRILADVFLREWPSIPDDVNRFNALIGLDPDGAYRTPRALADPERRATTWIRKGTPITPELRRLLLFSTSLTERFFPAWSPQFVGLYISSPLGFNTGLSLNEPNWVWALAADFD